MKGKDNIIFWLILVVSLFLGIIIYDKKSDSYSDIITFLSIMIGFQITSLSILFNSVLKRTLYDKKIPEYGTELHRLKDFYKHSLIFEVVSIVLIFILPNVSCSFSINFFSIEIGKQLLILPILTGSIYCFYKILNDLLRIFTYPTND